MSNKSEKQERRAFSINEAAETCGLSRATIYRLIKQRKLATLKIGTDQLVRLEAIDALLAGGT